MSAHHHAADCSQVFDADDTTETHTPDAEHREALELLGYATVGRVRLTVREWRQVTRVVAALNGARSLRSVPRSAWDGQDGIRTPPGAPGASEGVA